MSAFMLPEVYEGLFVVIENERGESRHAPAPADLDKDEHVAEERKGFLYRLSAPGYMDCTDWSPAESEEAARESIQRDYEVCAHCGEELAESELPSWSFESRDDEPGEPEGSGGFLATITLESDEEAEAEQERVQSLGGSTIERDGSFLYCIVQDEDEARKELGSLPEPRTACPHCGETYPAQDDMERGLRTITDARTAALVWNVVRGFYDAEHVEATAAWVRSCYHRPSVEELRLHAANELLGLHGVEGFELPDGSFLSYCNTGDSYEGTIVHTDEAGFVFSSYADELERIEREAEEDEAGREEAERDEDDEAREDEPSEDDEPSEPEPGDYIISSNGFRLSVGQHEGKHLGTFQDDEAAHDAIRKHAHTEGFFPSVWFVSDHGNVSRYGEPGFGEPFDYGTKPKT